MSQKIYKTEFWKMYQEGTMWFKASFNMLLFGFAMGGLTLGIYWLCLIWQLIMEHL